MSDIPLYKVLKASYEDVGNADLPDEFGYTLDKDLSTKKYKVYHHPKENRLLFSVAGTDPTDPSDLHADVRLGFGGGNAGRIVSGLIGGAIGGSFGVGAGLALHNHIIGNGVKGTERYKSAHKALRDAKKKYKTDTAILAGHSLGGMVVSGIAGKNDDIYSFNKGATIGQTTRPNEKAYRIKGDLVSAFSQNAIVLKPHRPEKFANLRSHHKVDYVKEPLANHALEHIQHNSPVILGKPTKPNHHIGKPVITKPVVTPTPHLRTAVTHSFFRENLGGY